MDFSKISTEQINMGHLTWLGFKEQNGALIKEGFDGEIQYKDGEFLYVRNGNVIERIHTNVELNDIYLLNSKSMNKLI